MSFYFAKNETGYDTPKSRSYHSKSDKDFSSEKHSSKYSRRNDDSRDSDRKSYHKSSGGYDKERSRDSYRDRHDSSRSNSKFNNDGMAGGNLEKINWSNYELSTFQKEFYNEQPSVKARSQKEVDDFRAEHQIAIKSSYCPKPVFSFAETGFPNYITEQLEKKYKTPTPIQSQGWPAALSGNDVIGIAQTGSGKTLSFLLPGFVHINAQPPLKSGDGPIGLVLAPTRELAMQIQEECVKFGRYAKISSTCVFGGADKYGQKRELSRGNQIVVATPGRLLDFLESNVINLRRVTYLVMDEADRMLDMGFEPQIRRIISQIRPDRQTLFWSATWPREVQKLALEFCREKPVHIVIGSNDLAVTTRIKQNVEVVDNSIKRYRITKVLEGAMDGSKILIFCQTKKGTDYVTKMLSSSGIAAIAIHGDKTQSQRDFIMRQFKTGRCNVLVATDLAARGLDVEDIKCVINYDFPTHIEDYIHRVGRTGRAGRTGISYTFFTREDYKHASKLIDILTEAEQEIPDELYRIARRPIPMNRRHITHTQANSLNNSQIKPPQKPYSYPTSAEKTSIPATTHTHTPTPTYQNRYVPQENKQHQQGQPTQQPQQPNYSNPAYMYDAYQGAMMNPYANGFNGYQQLSMPSEAYQINAMNYYNQLQAAFGISNMIQPPAPGQVQGQEKKQDTNQPSSNQNMNSFPALNPQYPPQNS